MKNLVLFDDAGHLNLYPLTMARSTAELRWGILTLKEKWEQWSGAHIAVKTAAYLQGLYAPVLEGMEWFANARLTPSEDIVDLLYSLKPNEGITWNNVVMLYRNEPQNLREWPLKTPPVVLEQVWDIFVQNGAQILADFTLLNQGQKPAIAHQSNTLFGSHPIFIHSTARVLCSTLNSEEGPIYVGPHAEIQEGCNVRGPFALGDYATLKMGAKVYPGTTVGPHCKVGGEVNNSVIMGYSNKAHDGFLGNAVIGYWCNLGADTNNSNLKNNYAEVKIWNYNAQKFVNTGLQFCGLIMGDHSKSGINTMFNTGTVVGFSSNIFGSGFPRNYIPSFSWGGAAGMSVYALNKALETAQKVYARRNQALSEQEISIFEYLFKLEQG